MKEQTIDQYIMHYEKYKKKRKRFKTDLGERIHGLNERIHGLNLLYGAGLNDSELKIAMQEVDYDKPEDMYGQAKKALKKYYGSSAITNVTNQVDLISVTPAVKEEVFQTNNDEYNSFLVWKQSRHNQKRFYTNNRNSGNPNNDNRKNFNNFKRFNPKDSKGGGGT